MSEEAAGPEVEGLRAMDVRDALAAYLNGSDVPDEFITDESDAVSDYMPDELLAEHELPKWLQCDECGGRAFLRHEADELTLHCTECPDVRRFVLEENGGDLTPKEIAELSDFGTQFKRLVEADFGSYKALATMTINGMGRELAKLRASRAESGGDVPAAGNVVNSQEDGSAARADGLATPAPTVGDRKMELLASFCAQCGPHVAVDEDGCCVYCGATATGEWASRIYKTEKVRHARDEALARVAELERRNENFFARIGEAIEACNSLGPVQTPRVTESKK